MNNPLDELKSLYAAERYDEALALTERMERGGLLYPEVFVWKGRCLLLGDGRDLADISDIERVYRQALDIDDEYAPALLELGWFYLNVTDDAARARPLFDKAFSLLRDALTEAVEGVARCLSETDTRAAAALYLALVKHNLLDSGRIRNLKDEIKGAGE
jgi:tetratricopeptide (TPR) repeat protein